MCQMSVFTGVTVNSLHPGAVVTEITRKIPQPFYYIFKLIMPLFFKVCDNNNNFSAQHFHSLLLACVCPQYA
jgi:hypothetical protein